MTTIALSGYQYASAFGRFGVNAEIELTDSALRLFREGHAVESLPHRIVNSKGVLRQAAARFLDLKYRDVFRGESEFDVEKLEAVRSVLDLNWSQFADLLGIDKGSLSNARSGKRRMIRSTQLLILERLAMELVRPGAALALLNGSAPEEIDEEMRRIVEKARYGAQVKTPERH